MPDTESYKKALFDFSSLGSQYQITIIYYPPTLASLVGPGQGIPEQGPLSIAPQRFSTRKEAFAYGKGVVDVYVEEDYNTALSKLGALSPEEKAAYKQGWDSQPIANNQ